MSEDTTPTKTPLISVVVPVYNAEAYLSESVESIRSQTYSRWELLLVDDASSDGSPGLLADFARRDPRIQVLSVPHGGTAQALNAGITAARGEWVAILDSDDLAQPERLAAQMAWMQKFDIDVCGACVRRFGESRQVMWFPESHEAVQVELLFRCALLPSAVMARASVLRDNPYLPTVVGEDYELWTRLAPRFRLGNAPRILTQYRTHAGQKSRVRQAEVMEAVRRCRQGHFKTLFPEASQEDAEALERVAESLPHPTLAELERAGQWLVRLAAVPDAFLRARLAGRWTAACRRSAHLGLPCFHLHQKIAAQFGPGASGRTLALWLMCAVRLRSGSRLAGILRHLTLKTRRNSHAPA